MKVFSFKYCEIFNNYFDKHLQTTDFVHSNVEHTTFYNWFSYVILLSMACLRRNWLT